MKKRVSFILPTRNRPDFVDQTLQAAKKYVKKNDELIMVDGSVDHETELVVKKYSKLVTKYLRTSDIGEGHKMNVGILNSTGEIIKPISDDDVIYPVAMEKAIQVLQKDDSLDALQCGGEGYQFNPNDKTFKFLFYEKVPKNVSIQHNFSALLQHVPCHLGLIYKRRILPVVGLYDTTFSGTDINFMARFIKSEINFKYFDICLYRHIQYAHSTELFGKIMNRDRSRTALILPDWNGAVAMDTEAVCDALGLPINFGNRGYVWVIKLLNLLRQITIGAVLIGSVGFIVEKIRNMVLSPQTNGFERSIKVLWTGKYW